MLSDKTTAEIIDKAFNAFNDDFDYNFSYDNVVVQFYNEDNAIQIFNDFIVKFGFKHEELSESYFQSIGGEAFPYGTKGDKEVGGIMVKLYPELTEKRLYHTMLHELAHIYCSRKEIEGGHFYDKYCASIPQTREERIVDGTMNAGYAIWREFVAEFHAQIIDPNSQFVYHVFEYESLIEQQLKDMFSENTSIKYRLSFLLVFIICTAEGLSDSWDDFAYYLRKMKFPFLNTVKIIYGQIHKDDWHLITPDFIYELGGAYLFDISNHFIS